MDKGNLALKADLLSGRFQAGAVKDRWHFISLEWPILFVDIRAGNGRKFTLRFECSGYPETAPTGTLWDISKQQQLAANEWPRGGRVSQVFNPSWLNGSALYIPCDRQSIAGHVNWISEFPWLIWNPALGILQYIEAVYETLQSHELQAA